VYLIRPIERRDVTFFNEAMVIDCFHNVSDTAASATASAVRVRQSQQFRAAPTLNDTARVAAECSPESWAMSLAGWT